MDELRVRLCVPRVALPNAAVTARETAALLFPDVSVHIRAYEPPPILGGHALVLTELRCGDGHVNGVGCSTDGNQAALTAIVETLERHTFRSWAPTGEVASSIRLGGTAIAVEQEIGSPLFPNEWPFRPFAPEQEMTWIAGVDLVSARRRFMPLALVAAVSREERLRELSTNGVAAGRSVAEATTSALFELLERDAVMRHWRKGIPYSLCAKRAVAPAGWTEIDALAWAQSGAPAALVFLYDGNGHFGVGTAAGPSAWSRARAEARQLAFRSVFWPPRDVQDPRRVDEHYLLYATRDGVGQILGRIDGSRCERPTSHKCDYDSAIARLAASGSDAVVTVVFEQEHLAIVRTVATGLYAMEGPRNAARTPVDPTVEAATYLPHPFG